MLGRRGEVLDMAVYHVAVFVRLLFCGRRTLVVSMTTPPLIGFTVALVSFVRRLSSIHYVQDLYPELLTDSDVVRRHYITKELGIFNRITFRTSKLVLVIGEAMRRKLWLNYAVDDRKTRVIENWSTPVTYSEPRATKPVRFTYSGNLGFAHDVSLLPDFASACVGLNPTFAFVGSGRKYRTVRPALSAIAGVSLEMSDYVARSEHSKVLADATFLVLAQSPATVGDILPSKLYSYLAAGRPMVYFGTSNSEVGQTLLKHSVGVVVEIEEDIEPAVRWLTVLVNDHPSYISVCQRVRGLSVTNGGVHRAARQYSDALRFASSLQV